MNNANNFKTYNFLGFNIAIPENWEPQKISPNKVLFKGPDIEKSFVSFVTSCTDKKDSNYQKMCLLRKKGQSQNKDYSLLSEKEITRPNFNGYLVETSFFSTYFNTELFVRDIYTENENLINILTTYIPFSHREDSNLEQTLSHILASFRYTTKTTIKNPIRS